MDTDYDLYQIPISGGIPVKIAIDNGRRPFTPPFQQILRQQQQQMNSRQSSRKEEILQTKPILEEHDLGAKDKGEKMQLLYDAKLNCYYDPERQEYFELKGPL